MDKHPSVPMFVIQMSHLSTVKKYPTEINAENRPLFYQNTLGSLKNGNNTEI